MPGLCSAHHRRVEAELTRHAADVFGTSFVSVEWEPGEDAYELHVPGEYPTHVGPRSAGLAALKAEIRRLHRGRD